MDDVDKLDATLATRAFEITVASSTVQLTDRKGDASYSTRNMTSHPVHANATVVVTPPAIASWFAVDQPARDFTPGVVQQIPVHIQVPADVPGGQYGFRLDVRGTANPDEEYAQGPGVSFTVPVIEKPPPPPPWWQKIPWWVYVAAAAAVLIIAGVVAFLLLRNVNTPNVVGQTLPNAQATLQAGSLKVGNTSEQATGAAENTVIQQVPGAATPAPRNSAVDLVIEAARVPVPNNLVGSTLADATTKLTQAGLMVGTVTNDVDNATPGTVIRTNPVAGTPVLRNGKVDLVLEAPFIAVPNGIINVPLAQAEAMLQQAGLRTGAISVLRIPNAPNQFVTAADPAPGTPVRRNTAVNLTVIECVPIAPFFFCQ